MMAFSMFSFVIILDSLYQTYLILSVSTDTNTQSKALKAGLVMNSTLAYVEYPNDMFVYFFL